MSFARHTLLMPLSTIRARISQGPSLMPSENGICVMQLSLADQTGTKLNHALSGSWVACTLAGRKSMHASTGVTLHEREVTYALKWIRTTSILESASIPAGSALAVSDVERVSRD